MKPTICMTSLLAFFIVALVPAATLAQDEMLRDQRQTLPAAPKGIESRVPPAQPAVLREETPAEAAARSKAEVEQARARAAASKARIAVPIQVRAWTARIIEAYPIDAKLNGIEGTVGVAVKVGTDGRATKCKVIQSSGHPALDNAACRGVERYSRFEPALDREGRPVTGEFPTNITYEL